MNNCANSSLVRPVTFAKSSRLPDALLASLYIFFNSEVGIPICLETAVSSFPPQFTACTKDSQDTPCSATACFRGAKASTPVSVANCICTINLENADPPASASIPTDDNAAAKPTMSPSVMPICFPAPAKRKPISVISDSVVAKLLPKSTIAEPRLLNLSCDICVMLAKRARDVAAVSADIFVDSPISIIVLVNPTTLSVFIPNCPAASATFAISS